jgi:hypothetical protein
VLLKNHPYLGLSLILVAILLLGFVVCRKHRLAMLFSAVVSAPFALWSPTFVPEYWQPVRVACFVAGPEDFAFAFASGGITWLAGTWPVRDRMTLEIRPRRTVARLFLCLLPSAAVTTLLWLIGVRVMGAVICGLVALSLLTLRLRSRLWPIGVSGAIGFGALYASVLATSFALWPHFAEQWTVDQLWGYFVFGLPLEEVIWALGFGAAWPLLVAYALDVRIEASVSHSA